MKEKCKLSTNSINVLYYGTLHRANSDQYGLYLSKMGPLLCWCTELPPYYKSSRLHRLIHRNKKKSKDQRLISSLSLVLLSYNRIECLMVITLVLYEGQDKSIENKGVYKYYSSVA